MHTALARLTAGGISIGVEAPLGNSWYVLPHIHYQSTGAAAPGTETHYV